MRILCSLLLLTVAASLNAQDFPNPKPTEAHKVLAMDAGVWDADVLMYLAGPQGEPTKYKAVEKNTLVSGKLYLRTEYRCQMGDRLFEGNGLTGYDAKKKRYTGLWVDSFTAAPTPVSFEYDKETKTMSGTSTVVDQESGQELKQKQVTTWVSDDEKKFTIYVVIEAGDQVQEIKIMESTAKRRAKKKKKK